jgi:hypothetical protein
VKKRRMKRGRKKIATKEKRRIKRVMTEKDNKNSDDSTQSINRAQHRSIVLLLFLQKQNLTNAIYLFGLTTHHCFNH